MQKTLYGHYSYVPVSMNVATVAPQMNISSGGAVPARIPTTINLLQILFVFLKEAILTVLYMKLHRKFQ